MQKVIYMAGGCFWGVEKAFKMLNGVLETTVGYANGKEDNVSYQQVKTGTTGHKETVKVVYDDEVISLNTLLDAFFIFVDPVAVNQQGHDIGSQYQSGVYYTNDEDKEVCENYFAKKKAAIPNFAVELGTLNLFVTGEEYHQDYLDKNPDGYCHIDLEAYQKIKQLNK